MFPHLSRAPIKEALIDIRCRPAESVSLKSLRGLHDRIRERYPTEQTRRSFKGEINIRDQSFIENFSVEGYHFVSKQEDEVVQFRLDGFTFSKLAPYGRWEGLRSEARRLWEIFREATEPSEVGRVAVRYMSELQIPVGPLAWREYLKVPPSLPEGMEVPMDQFLSRFLVEDPDTGSNWIVTQALQPGNTPATRTLFLDFDVFKLGNFETDSSIWETTEILRIIKNRLFFGSLTEKALDLCR